MGLGRTVVRFVFAATFSALLIAVGARLLVEIRAARRREVDLTAPSMDSDERAWGGIGTEWIELDRATLPGISIRT